MSKNDITGDKLVTKAPSAEYSAGWDRIFKQCVDHVYAPTVPHRSDEKIIFRCVKCGKKQEEQA